MFCTIKANTLTSYNSETSIDTYWTLHFVFSYCTTWSCVPKRASGFLAMLLFAISYWCMVGVKFVLEIQTQQNFMFVVWHENSLARSPLDILFKFQYHPHTHATLLRNVCSAGMPLSSYHEICSRTENRPFYIPLISYDKYPQFCSLHVSFSRLLLLAKEYCYILWPIDRIQYSSGSARLACWARMHRWPHSNRVLFLWGLWPAVLVVVRGTLQASLWIV